MTTKAPADVNYFSDDDPLKKIYSGIDELQEEIPLPNDRNRLSFCLDLFIKKEVATIYDAIKQSKPNSKKDYKELETIVTNKLKEKGLI